MHVRKVACLDLCLLNEEENRNSRKSKTELEVRILPNRISLTFVEKDE